MKKLRHCTVAIICIMALVVSSFAVMPVGADAATYKTLTLDRSENHGYIDYYGEVEYWTFTADTSGTLALSMGTDCDVIGYRLYDGNNTSYKVYNGTTVIPAGKYYVEVRCSDCSDDGKYGDYYLLASFTSFDSIDAEPNDIKENAVALSPGVTVEGTAYPAHNDYYDWYSFNLKYDSKVYILMDRVYTYNLSVFNEAGEAVVKDLGGSFSGTPSTFTMEKGKYYVSVYKEAENQGLSEVYNLTITPVEYPTYSGIKTATSTGIGKAKITWTKSKNADGYEIYRKWKDSDYWGTPIAVIESGSTTSWTDNSGPYPGDIYVYGIRAYRDDPNSREDLYSEVDTTGKAVVGKVPTPKNVKTTKYTNSIKVSWSKVNNASGYKIYRKTNGGSYKLVKTINDVSDTSWTNTSVVRGNNYTYKVKAFYSFRYYDTKTETIKNKYIYSSYSDTSKAKLTGSISAPKNVRASKYSSYNKISWSKSKTAAGYKIYRKTGSGSYKLVKTVTSGSTTSWKDKSVKKGKKYTYKIKAYYKNYSYSSSKGGYVYKTVNSSYSNTDSVKR